MEHTQRFLDIMDLTLRQAGVVAQHLQGKVKIEIKEHEPTPEGQAVTGVDFATQDLILTQLLQSWPDVAVDAEEDTLLAKRFSTRASGARRGPLIVLDPVDGTYNYTQGSPEYGVMAGLIFRGAFQAAMVHYPTRDETYWAVRGQGCFARRGAGEAEEVKVTLTSGNQPIQRLLVSAAVPEDRIAALKSVAAEVDVCRCSAFDGACLALKNAQGSVAENRADRRRSIALFLSLEAGGVVLMGERHWQGEDPKGLGRENAPTICAINDLHAAKLLKAYRTK